MQNRILTILCNDDEQAALFVRTLVLEAEGYKVLTATTAEQALDLFKANEVHLVITDHLLPTIRGSDLAREMKQLKPNVPVALLTGLGEPPAGAEYADAFIVKGQWAPQELLRQIAQLIERGGK